MVKIRLTRNNQENLPPLPFSTRRDAGVFRLLFQIMVGVVLTRKREARKLSGTGVKSVGTAAGADPADPNAPAPVPVFEVRALTRVTGLGLPHIAPSQDTYLLFPYLYTPPPPCLPVHDECLGKKTPTNLLFSRRQNISLGAPGRRRAIMVRRGTISLRQQGNTTVARVFARDTQNYPSIGKWALRPFKLLRDVWSFDMTFVAFPCTTGSPICSLYAFLCSTNTVSSFCFLFFAAVFLLA